MDEALHDEALHTAELLDALRQENSAALGRQLARHLPYVRRIVSLRLGTRLADLYPIDDVVQEAMTTALGSAPKVFPHPGAFRSWLATVTLTRIRELARFVDAEKRRLTDQRAIEDSQGGILTSVLSRADAASPSQEALGHEMEERLEAALLELSERKRRLVIAFHLEGKDYGEIAEELGYENPSTVRVAMARALADIFRKLDLEPKK